MNDLLKQRIARLLESLSDERGYQILDYIEFLDSKYAERARPGGLFARITETVEDTMRAGKLPIQAISGTMGIVDGAAKVMKGLAAAGQAVVDEAVKAAESASKPAEPTVKPPSRPPPAISGRDAARAVVTECPHAQGCHPERSEDLPAIPTFPEPLPSLRRVTHDQDTHGRTDRGTARVRPGGLLRVHPGHQPARRRLAGRRIHDRLGDLHRLRRHRAAGGPLGAGRPPARLDRDRRS